IFIDTNFGPGKARFDGARFHQMTFFNGATFAGGISFEDTEARINFPDFWGSKSNWPPGWIVKPSRPPQDSELWGPIVRESNHSAYCDVAEISSSPSDWWSPIRWRAVHHASRAYVPRHTVTCREGPTCPLHRARWRAISQIAILIQAVS